MSTLKDNISTENDDEFKVFIEFKMHSIGISNNLINQLELVKAKLFLDYDPLEIMDMHVLNTKIEHIFQAELSGDYDEEQLFKIAFQILKTKE